MSCFLAQRFGIALAVTSALAVSISSSFGALVGRYAAADYDPNTGIWTDTGLDDLTNNFGRSFFPEFSVDNRPALTPNATPTGQAALTWNGSAQYFDLVSPFGGGSLATPGLTSAPSFTILVVARPASASGVRLVASSGGAGGIGVRFDGTANEVTLTKINVEDIAPNTPGANDSDFHVYSVSYDGTNWSTRRDGVPTASGTYALTTGGFSPIDLIGTGPGLGAQYQGDISELRFYDSVLDVQTLASVEQSLLQTYIVPEPASLSLLGGLMVFALRRRK